MLLSKGVGVSLFWQNVASQKAPVETGAVCIANKAMHMSYLWNCNDLF